VLITGVTLVPASRHRNPMLCYHVSVKLMEERLFKFLSPQKFTNRVQKLTSITHTLPQLLQPDSPTPPPRDNMASLSRDSHAQFNHKDFKYVS